MAQNQTSDFPHRHNPDGSHDPICFACFRTIASEMDEVRLAEAESKHVCEPVDLERFRKVAPYGAQESPARTGRE